MKNTLKPLGIMVLLSRLELETSPLPRELKQLISKAFKDNVSNNVTACPYIDYIDRDWKRGV